FGFEYGTPLSIYTHFYGKSFVDIPLHEAGTRSSLNISATLSHQVGERLELDGTYAFLWGPPAQPYANYSGFTRATLHTLEGNFVYFREDRLRSVVGITYTSLNDRSFNYNSTVTPDALSRWNVIISFGFSYNII